MHKRLYSMINKNYVCIPEICISAYTFVSIEQCSYLGSIVENNNNTTNEIKNESQQQVDVSLDC